MARSASAPRLPLYASVDRSIRETIARGEWSPGTQLPPLPALATRFGCGISTVRRVVETLTDENVLIAMQGKGIFVKSYLKHGYWNRFHRFQRLDGSLIERYDDTLERFEVVRAGESVAHELGIAPEDWVVHWERRMDFDGEPLRDLRVGRRNSRGRRLGADCGPHCRPGNGKLRRGRSRKTPLSPHAHDV